MRIHAFVKFVNDRGAVSTYDTSAIVLYCNILIITMRKVLSFMMYANVLHRVSVERRKRTATTREQFVRSSGWFATKRVVQWVVGICF